MSYRDFANEPVVPWAVGPKCNSQVHRPWSAIRSPSVSRSPHLGHRPRMDELECARLDRQLGRARHRRKSAWAAHPPARMPPRWGSGGTLLGRFPQGRCPWLLHVGPLAQAGRSRPTVAIESTRTMSQAYNCRMEDQPMTSSFRPRRWFRTVLVGTVLAVLHGSAESQAIAQDEKLSWDSPKIPRNRKRMAGVGGHLGQDARKDSRTS